MSHKVSITLILVAGLLSTGAIAGQPQTPGGQGGFVSGIAKGNPDNLGDARSTFGGAKSTTEPGGNPALNDALKDVTGGDPTKGATP